MATTADYLKQLQTDRDTLASNLTEQGVTLVGDETFTELAPKVLEISGGDDFEINDASYLFYEGARFNEMDKTLAKCKNVTSAFNMFRDNNKNAFTTVDLRNFDTSKITNMQSMFQSCYYLGTIQGIEDFDTSSCTNMANMFYNITQAELSLDLSNWNTSNVTTMYNMFHGCQQMRRLILSNFNTSNVTTFYSMFNNLWYLVELDVSSFDTSNCKDFSSMFSQMRSIRKLDVSNFDMSKATSTSNMFAYSVALYTLVINNPNVFKLTNVNALNSTPIANGTGYVYVPDDLVDTYKSTTNWSTYADQIKPISELPVEE